MHIGKKRERGLANSLPLQLLGRRAERSDESDLINKVLSPRSEWRPETGFLHFMLE
jgi:hypothetical protein